MCSHTSSLNLRVFIIMIMRSGSYKHCKAFDDWYPHRLIKNTVLNICMLIIKNKLNIPYPLMIQCTSQNIYYNCKKYIIFALVPWVLQVYIHYGHYVIINVNSVALNDFCSSNYPVYTFCGHILMRAQTVCLTSSTRIARITLSAKVSGKAANISSWSMFCNRVVD